MSFRIPRSEVEGKIGDELLLAVIEPVWPDTTVEFEDELKHIALATPGQRALYVIALFFREVDNGGLHQFFFNSSGLYADEVVDGLRLVGADRDADILEQSFSIFPQGRVPVDWRERRQALCTVPKQELIAKLGPIEKQLYDGEKRLSPYFHAYIKAHPEEFFVD